MPLCGDCRRFKNPNHDLSLIEVPLKDRNTTCEKGKEANSLDYSCQDFKPTRHIERMENIVNQGIDEGVSMRELGKRLSSMPTGKRATPVLKLRGGHIDSPPSQTIAGELAEVEDEGRESSPPLKLKLRTTQQPKLGGF